MSGEDAAMILLEIFCTLLAKKSAKSQATLNLTSHKMAGPVVLEV